jgi:pyridoxamine 5'-phosphate oxidase
LAKYDGKDIPLPDFWGGYIIHPSSFEFWQGRPSRLHDRMKYTKEQDSWLIVRLSP